MSGNIDGNIHANRAETSLYKGDTNGMALTEYTAEPISKPCPAGSLVPQGCRLPDGSPDYIRLILTAAVYDVVEATELTRAINLSNRLECNVLLKREDLQPVFSFKLRGAYNKMAHLRADEKWKGVVACSAGNHAQGVAYSARRLKIPATIVMPEGTPEIKYRNVARLGGVVKRFGPDFDAAKAEAARLAEKHGLTSIPPFDDPYVIAGQGTIGVEILRQTNLQELEAIFCCVGGGGLIAGIGAYVKRIAPRVKIIGVETFDANAMVQSLKMKKRVTLKDVGLFADGAAVKVVGEETFRLCSEVVDDVIQVTTDETCAAIKDVFEDTRSILEPAGALSLAGLKKYAQAKPSDNPNRGLVAIASGANMNFDRLRFVVERAALGEQKEALIGVSLAEKPRTFIKLIQNLAPHEVTEFAYRYGKGQDAHILMGITVDAAKRTEQLADLFERLAKQDMKAVDLSDDELAKSHVRHLVGGRSAVPDEKLFMFKFPERPGALIKFLTTLKPDRNISMFHYRNSGGDIANILAGIQCPDDRTSELEELLRKLGYPFVDCTDSPTYQTFLKF